MIRLSNAQAIAFTSKIMSDLLNDSSRRFPVSDAFKIADMIKSITDKIPLYRNIIREIVHNNGGVVDKNGNVSYKDIKCRINAEKQIDELNATMIEFPGEALKPSESWPNLTLSEALILKPLLNVEN